MVMLSLEELRTRWQKTIERAGTLADLKLAVRSQGNDSPCVSGLRSVCWKIFLLFHSTDSSTWTSALTDSRIAYGSLREHFLRYVERPEELGSALDPLDDDKNSPWNILRQDEELRAEIKQDVERCMPDEQYFRRARTQQMLLDILFIFCKMNQDVGYRQGMHELLAPILWVIESDAFGNIETELVQAGVENLVSDTLSATFIEHDAFTIFALLMQSAKSFYELGEPDRRASNTSKQSNGASPIVERSKRIHEIYLASLDPELADHLTVIEVLPQIFLIRWIRILFGREFPFESLLSLWDMLFAEDPGLDLVDMICVAMLLRIRWQLIEADYSVALTLLLKYPVPNQPHGPQTFVEDAIYLRENFNTASARKIITTYSGKTPQHYTSTSRPATPSGGIIGLEQKQSWRRSPLPSPARFLQHQGGVEALLQGAAKGVFERGERLGINKAVRDAVDEVKKNMQNLQTPSPPSIRRSSDFARRSHDEGKAVPSTKKTVASMEQRNKQLSQMLDDAVNDLRKLSNSETDVRSKSKDSIDPAIAKLQFVQVYLEDPSMPLPPDSSENASATKSQKHSAPGSNPLQSNKDSPFESENQKTTANINSAPQVEAIKSPITSSPPSLEDSLSSSIVTSESSGQGLAIPARPRAPIPTRSTLAQSSFAFMLEPDESSATSKSSSPKTSSPFLASGKRPQISGNREKAFLFGGETEDVDQGPWKPSAQIGLEEEFNLGTIRGSKSR